MKMNFKGLVDLHTLPKTTPLLPLYEAIINSIQSIEDAQISNGKIEIIVERDKQMNLFNQWETDIENIIIVDNGIGFDDENYNSFDTYASEYKIQKGCKGVGRMLWLKAFCSVSIESIFVEEDKKKCRTFLFDANHAVHDMKVKELSSDVLQTTKVRLNGLREQYKGNCPKKLDTIAKNILNHCFTYYVLGKAPKIIVTIIEFKRPGREHYNDAENPIRQIKEYMDDIVEGKVKTKDGEFLNGTENIRFFCYIICDVDLSIKKLAKLEDLKVTPDNMGFYKYIDSYKAYLEIIPYNKLIQDSKKRNRILFDKLFNQS